MTGGSSHCSGDKDQDHPQEKEIQKKQNDYLRRPYCEKKISKKQRRGKIYPFECRVPKNSKER